MLLVLIIASMRFIDKSSDMFYNILCIVVVHSLTFIVVVHTQYATVSFNADDNPISDKIGRINSQTQNVFSLLNKQMEVTYIACRSLT
jgi:hypothetical protein